MVISEEWDRSSAHYTSKIWKRNNEHLTITAGIDVHKKENFI